MLESFITDNPLLNKYQEAIKNKEASGVYPVALALQAIYRFQRLRLVL